MKLFLQKLGNCNIAISCKSSFLKSIFGSTIDPLLLGTVYFKEFLKIQKVIMNPVEHGYENPSLAIATTFRSKST